MVQTIFGIFSEKTDAEEAIGMLKKSGYNPKDISIVMKGRKEGEQLADDTGTDVLDGAAAGATTGAVVGGLAGLLASIMLPGLGAFFIGGPIAAALGLTGAAATAASGAVTGAVAGGLIGILTELGVTEDDARVYETRVQEGGILVAVPARKGEENEVERILTSTHADQIKSVTAKR